jgi:hypothetical protein
MSQPARTPDRGDLPPRVVAQRLGMLLPDFEACRIELERRCFPERDPTTGGYCIEAVDRSCSLSAIVSRADRGSPAVVEDRLRIGERGIAT